MKDLPRIDHADLLVGVSRADDAGVFRVSEEMAVIQTVDFFTPIVDDPFAYGQISAANSLSDVYAMGGQPITALNICAFPKDEIEHTVVAEILRGGQEKVTEAGAVVVGGHTVDDPEPKYGLSVTGVAHPDGIVTNAGALPGDRMVLTKPLGTGLVVDAFMNDQLSEEEMRPVVTSMLRLNKAASEQMTTYGAHACTDITGFGLLGHALRMATESSVGLRLWTSSIPHFNLALKIAEGRAGGGMRRNRAQFASSVRISGDVPESWIRLIYDPQTSGGLLICLSAKGADALAENLHERGLVAAVIGEVVSEHPGQIEVTT